MSKGKVLLVLYKGGEHAKQEPKLLGSLENELGIRKAVEARGYELVTTDSKDGDDSEVDKHLADAEIIITTPFFPAYITRERIARAPKLKLCVTAGVGLDHIDLDAANERKIGVIEVTGSNVVSVAEHVIMTMLVLVRNFTAAHQQAIEGEWDIAGVAKNAYDLEDKVVSTIGCGRIGYRVLERLIAFNPKKLLYYDYQELPAEAVAKLNQASKLFNGVDNIVERVESLEEMVSRSDVVAVNCPLHEKSRGLVDKKLLSHFKDGAWLVPAAGPRGPPLENFHQQVRCWQRHDTARLGHHLRRSGTLRQGCRHHLGELLLGQVRLQTPGRHCDQWGLCHQGLRPEKVGVQFSEG